MTQQEKLTVLRTVEGSPLATRGALTRLGVAPSTYYRWRRTFRRQGSIGLQDRSSHLGRDRDRCLSLPPPQVEVDAGETDGLVGSSLLEETGELALLRK